MQKKDIVAGWSHMDKNVFFNKQKKLLKGFFTAWVLIAAGIIGSGMIMLLTPMSIRTGSYVIVAAAAAGGFLFGAAAASAMGKRGLAVGFAAGLILSMSILAVYLLFFGVSVDPSFNYLPLLLPAASGSIGGLYGVSQAHRKQG